MIHTYKSKNKIKILIQDICTTTDIEELKSTFYTYKNIEISLIDIEIIPALVIKLFNKYRYNTTLDTNNKTLWIYLRSFDIDIKLNYEPNKNIDKHCQLEAIAIGGSAGALKNIMQIIKKLPFCDITVFIVIHLLPKEKSRLVSILKPLTHYTVKEPSHKEIIKKGHIYIAPPDYHILVENKTILKTQSKKVNFCRPSIDVLFKSLAKEYQQSLLSILTCGYLDDGSRSLSDIKKYNATSIIQDPNGCEANDIPLNAIITKNYDWIFSLEDINTFIHDKLNFTLDLDDRIKSFVDKIHHIYNYDFKHYDKSSLKRRVELLRLELGFDNFNQFETLILNNKNMFELLFKKISINVSEFFRDPLMYLEFEKTIIPILKTYPHIRIWCSASAKGQEAYSIAMILDKYQLLHKTIIYATDFNPLIIKQAKNALFTKDDYAICRDNYKKISNTDDLLRWFNIDNNIIEVKEYIKNKVQFFGHNLVTDGEINEFHIVFCRNVLIYFDEELQNKVIRLIYNSLIRDGYLFLGSSEHIKDNNKFLEVKNKHYKKLFKKAKEF